MGLPCIRKPLVELKISHCIETLASLLEVKVDQGHVTGDEHLSYGLSL